MPIEKVVIVNILT